MAFGINTLADEEGYTMKVGYLRVAVVLWIVALVAGGYAESYPNRPTASEMNDIVELGSECFRGVNERCLATQYQINPTAYRVAPPFVKTNSAIGWYLDQNTMMTLDNTIKALIPYYADDTVDIANSNTAPAIMLTVTGVWAKLQIGDKISQFTGTPAIGTNAATYGDYSTRIYQVALLERYKVLRELTRTAEPLKEAINGSYRNIYTEVEKKMFGYCYSNKVNGQLVWGWSPEWQAHVFGWEADGELCTYPRGTNYVYQNTYVTDDLTWAEIKQCAEWSWYHYDGSGPTNYGSVSDIIVATNGINYAAGEAIYAIADGSIGWQVTNGAPMVPIWNYCISMQKQYSTWRWFDCPNTNFTCSGMAFYAKPRSCVYSQETEIHDTNDFGWFWPREWENTIYGTYEEFSGMTQPIFYRIDDSCFRVNGNYTEIEFGSDEQNPLAGAGTFPNVWPDQPSEGVNNYDNTGSVGRAKGVWMHLTFDGEYVFYRLKDWQFKYCMNNSW